MPQPIVLVEGITELDIPDKRKTVGQVHSYLRQCIIDGRLAPDTVLSQASLAKQLGVSRTPLREVLRMLQEEGFVESEPNQRMRVAGLDPEALDATYGSRIVLETLAVSLTIDAPLSQHRRAETSLKAMRTAVRTGDLHAWFTAHSKFHDQLTCGIGSPMRTQLRALSDQCSRYIRIGQELDPAQWQVSGDEEHERILEAFLERDEDTAVVATAHHLERTAFLVFDACAPDFSPRAVPAAVRQVHLGRESLAARTPTLVE